MRSRPILISKDTRVASRTKWMDGPIRLLRCKKVHEPRTRVNLLFDSFLEPRLGSRSAAYTQRYLLYRAEPYHIDLLIELHPDGSGGVDVWKLNI